MSVKFLMCFLAVTSFCSEGVMAAALPYADDYTNVCDMPANNHNGKTNREVCQDVHQFCVAFNGTNTFDDDVPLGDDMQGQDFRCQQSIKCKSDGDCAGHSYQGSGELKCIKEHFYKWNLNSAANNGMHWKTSRGQCGISSRAVFQVGCDQERTSSSERRLARGEKTANLVFNNFADFNALDCNHIEENNKTIAENCATMGKSCMNLTFSQVYDYARQDDASYEFPLSRTTFKSAICEVPLYYCDEYDCESMGYTCGNSSYSRWDDDDYNFARYERPFCVQELDRKYNAGFQIDDDVYDDNMGNDTQTRLVVPLNCEGVPSPAPTIAPTKSTTISVAVQFDITASQPPTNADKTALKEAIANATDVTTNQVNNFVVTATSARRLREKNIRRLTVYTWSVDCDIATDLDSVSSTSSAEFQTAVSADLSAASFTNSVLAKVSSATGVSSITTTAATRSPTMVPTMIPFPAPTAAPQKKNDDDDNDDISTGALAGIIVGGVVVLLMIGGGAIYFCKRSNKVDASEKVSHRRG